MLLLVLYSHCQNCYRSYENCYSWYAYCEPYHYQLSFFRDTAVVRGTILFLSDVVLLGTCREDDFEDSGGQTKVVTGSEDTSVIVDDDAVVDFVTMFECSCSYRILSKDILDVSRCNASTCDFVASISISNTLRTRSA
jgi:hypothetical protein